MLGIVAAFKEEVSEYIARGRFRLVERSGPYQFYRARRGPAAALVLGAVGKRGAREATGHLLDNYGPRLVVSAGFAGAVRPDLNTGDVFVCDRVLSMEGPPASWTVENANERLLSRGSSAANNGARPMGCVSVSQFVRSAPMKAWLGKVLRVGVIDLESYWVTDVAASHGVPHAVVRVVLDPMDRAMPDFLADSMRPGAGSARVKALCYALRRPHRVGGLLRLSSQVKLARRSLADYLTSQPWN